MRHLSSRLLIFPVWAICLSRPSAFHCRKLMGFIVCSIVTSQLSVTDIVCRHWPHLTSTYSKSTGLHCDKFTSIYSQCSTASSFHWLPVYFRILWRSVCWPTKYFMKNSLFIFTLCLPHHSHPVHWNHPSRNVSRHITLTWPFPIETSKLLHRICCWTPIWLLRHCAWLHRAYWRCRTLIAW